LTDCPKKTHYTVGCIRKRKSNADETALEGRQATQQNRTVPVRRSNAELRKREYLTPAEINKLMAAAKYGRYGQRDATLILVAYRHGLRAVEVADLEWSQVEWGRNPALHVRRKKNGKPTVHPIRGDELRMLRELHRNTEGAFVFQTERGGPFTADAVNRLIKRIGHRAGFPFQVHAHMLRHACGYALANAGHDTRLIQDWLGHRAIQHTARYTELSPIRFKDVWR
jgi:type 1 fimbriae regulatory protein FimB/type 1 fimbriae regulatory protein FimE